MRPTSTPPGAALSPEVDPLWSHPLAQRWLRGVQRLRHADRARPWRLDALLAAAVLSLGVANLSEEHRPAMFGVLSTVPVGVVLATVAVQALPLVWRRRAPLAVFVIVLAVCVLQLALGVLLRSDISLMIALYGLARYAALRRLPWAAVGTVAALVLASYRVKTVELQPLTSLFFLLSAATAAATLGLAARIRQAQLAALADRAARLEIEREQRVKLATVAERARVSREMHDIVGHNLAVMIGLADGAASLAATDPARSGEALHIIAGTGRQALSELRRTLGALREQPFGAVQEVELSPQPGIADLAALLERIRAAGPQVTYRTAGDATSLAAGLQLAIYRIVQEALTNTLKHAGARTIVDVTVEVGDQDVRVRVEDTGPPDREPDRGRDDYQGQGLVGIHERAALAGGTAHAGPRRGGGWTVRAVLPLSRRNDQP